ncbi:hypothetical protein QWY86_00565 [Pedobacter aquatilis]|uniref:hypothetical protein n=1 Tax=Pedobacter aquatilis TaxID=351343 RepID=UPI0025B28356|nr:hypothetical protein [Pedobacter aquatilis]MDN3585141.1 hypothetical protein [Pedobacter aquatilis]
MPVLRKISTLCLFIFFHSICVAQVSYFGKQSIPADKFEIFKKTTTLFTLQYKDYAELEKFDEAIKKSWTITPYKIIKPEDLAKYDTTANYSFFYFDAYSEKIDETAKANVVYVLKLATPGKKPKEKEESILATVTLFADTYTNFQVNTMDEQSGSKRAKKSRLLGDLFNRATFYNWSPGILTGYLKQINDGINSNDDRVLELEFYNKVRLPQLATQTLYVPEYIKRAFSTITTPGAVSNYNASTIQEPYTYKLKFALYNELDNLILDKSTPIKYVIYTQRGNDKIISVYDSRDHQIIYQKFSPNTLNFEMNDLSSIQKLIKTIK